MSCKHFPTGTLVVSLSLATCTSSLEGRGVIYPTGSSFIESCMLGWVDGGGGGLNSQTGNSVFIDIYCPPTGDSFIESCRWGRGPSPLVTCLSSLVGGGGGHPHWRLVYRVL